VSPAPRGHSGSIRRLARNADYRRLWIGDGLSDVGSQMTSLAMPLLVLSLTGSAAKAGLVGVARTLAYPLSSLPVGALADRLDRRRLLIAGSLIRMGAIGSVPVALALGRPPLAQLMAVALIDAVLYTTAVVAGRSLVAQLVEPAELPDAIALGEGRQSAAMLGGPPLGGALFGIARGLPFLTDAVSFLATLIALLRVRMPSALAGSERATAAGVPAARAGARRELVAGAAWLWRHPFLRDGALLYAAANTTIAAVELLGLLIARRHGASSAAIGGGFAIIGAAGIASATIAGPLRRRLSSRRAVLIEPWFYALLMPLLLIARTPVPIGLVIGVMFLPLTVSSSVVAGARLALAPDELRSRVQAGAMLIGSSISWLGPLAVGVLFGSAGERTTVLVVTGWSVAIAALATASRGLRASIEPPAAISFGPPAGAGPRPGEQS
jgi:predicted MFS family arabinose efflux permease